MSTEYPMGEYKQLVEAIDTHLLCTHNESAEMLAMARRAIMEMIDRWEQDHTIDIRDEHNNIIHSVVWPDSEEIMNMAVADYIIGAIETAAKIDRRFIS